MKRETALTAIVATALLWVNWSAFGQQSSGQAQRPGQAPGTGQPPLNKSSVTKDQSETQVRPDDVAAWEKRTGLRISAGDALLLRTRRPGGGTPRVRGGYDPALIPFLKERDIALLGADVPQEGGQIPGVSLPMH